MAISLSFVSHSDPHQAKSKVWGLLAYSKTPSLPFPLLCIIRSAGSTTLQYIRSAELFTPVYCTLDLHIHINCIALVLETNMILKSMEIILVKY